MHRISRQEMRVDEGRGKEVIDSGISKELNFKSANFMNKKHTLRHTY